MKAVKAGEPFRFYARLSLTVATGVRARDLKELLEGVRSLPDEVIYSHTFRFLQQHQFLAPEPPNDFAVWASEALQDEGLAERLCAIDTVRCESIAQLRGALASTMEARLKLHGDGRAAPEGEEFHFLRSVRFSMPTPHEATDLESFAECLKKISVSSLYLHAFEARLRPPLGVNDFTVWLDKELGEKALARRLARLDPYSQTLEELRKKVVGLVEERLAELSRA